MDLLVHPKSVFLIVYPGGYCGEFLAWWLSLHPKCIRTGLRGIDNNRYVGIHDYDYVYSEQGSRDFLFLTTHPHSIVSKNGFTVPDTNQHLIFCASPRTHRFYFLLYLIKTVFFKFTTERQPAIFESAEQWNEFKQYLEGRTEFAGVEAEYWIKKQPYTSVADIVTSRWKRSLIWPMAPAPSDINIASLFFGDYLTGYAELCKRLNLTPEHRFDHLIPEYHQRNVKLVERFTGLDLDNFLDLDDDVAMIILVRACLTRLGEP